jgi:hypothetical protein
VETTNLDLFTLGEKKKGADAGVDSMLVSRSLWMPPMQVIRGFKNNTGKRVGGRFSFILQAFGQ